MTVSAYIPSAEYPTYADYRKAKQREHRKAWKERNKEAYLASEYARRRERYASEPEYKAKVNASNKRVYEADPAKVKERNKTYLAANKERVRTYFREYNWIKRRRLVLATPRWADLPAIREFYSATRSAGLEVDHKIPIAGKEVCGLHVLNNLQALSRSDNASKGNRYAG